MKKKLFLLDVFPILYRSHFAMLGQHLKTTSGLNTSAILGFCNYLFYLLFKENPTHIAAAFDSYSFDRSVAHSFYKANREKMPEDIVTASRYVSSIIEALNIPQIKLEGYEADDVIGTVANQAVKKGFEVYIVSPDKDFAQLVSDRIFLYRPSYKGVNFEILDAVKVREKYGVSPDKIADLLALMGDAVDNIPGVPKIGEKTALDLLSQFENLEQVLENVDEIKKASVKKALIENEESAKLSKKLALIYKDLPINFSEDDLRISMPDTEYLVKLLDELEFVRLKERIFNSRLYKKAFMKANQREQVAEHRECSIEYLISELHLTSVLDLFDDESFSYVLKTKGDYADICFAYSGKTYFYTFKTEALPALILKILANENIKKVTYDVKESHKLLQLSDNEMKGEVYDLLLMDYLASPTSNHQLDKIISRELGVPMNEQNGPHKLCVEVSYLNDLASQQMKLFADPDFRRLYSGIDLPLAEVLARMELNGIKIDIEILNQVTESLINEIKCLERKIYQLTGEEFNINSARQTGEQLSRIIKHTNLKKTKTGQISTSEATLQEFAEDYEIANLILRYRKITKLISTYTESLPKYIHPETGRIHADFLQTITATGRLSCSNPNLQNLPVRSEEGKEVRKAVVAENEDYVILSADYSQIELRLLAALSGDEALTDAFSKRHDVHTITAAKVFNVTEDEVTDDMRSKAKMVNYGIAYGISPFGLSRNLSISMSEAREIIDLYFQKFPKIREFIQATIEDAKKYGYSVTLTGRKRYIDEIKSANGTERRAAERIAINAPIQGLAADIIKISMIQLDKIFKSRSLKSKMIMQIHDELVFEVFRPELDEVCRLVKEKMEGALRLNVPLEVNLGVGENWLELEDYLC